MQAARPAVDVIAFDLEQFPAQYVDRLGGQLSVNIVKVGLRPFEGGIFEIGLVELKELGEGLVDRGAGFGGGEPECWTRHGLGDSDDVLEVPATWAVEKCLDLRWA